MFANVHIVNATDWTNCEDKLLENFQLTQNTKVSNQTLKSEKWMPGTASLKTPPHIESIHNIQIREIWVEGMEERNMM